MINNTSSEMETGYSEANATFSVCYLHISGYECILSIQAETGTEVLKKAESAIAHLTEAKCLPLRKDIPNFDRGFDCQSVWQ